MLKKWDVVRGSIWIHVPEFGVKWRMLASFSNKNLIYTVYRALRGHVQSYPKISGTTSVKCRISRTSRTRR